MPVPSLQNITLGQLKQNARDRGVQLTTRGDISVHDGKIPAFDPSRMNIVDDHGRYVYSTHKMGNVAKFIAPHLGGKNMVRLSMTQRRIRGTLQNELTRRRRGKLLAKIAVRKVDKLASDVGPHIKHRVVQRHRVPDINYYPFEYNIMNQTRDIYGYPNYDSNSGSYDEAMNLELERQQNVANWTRARHRALKHGSAHYRRRYKQAKAAAKKYGTYPPSRYITPHPDQQPSHWPRR